jgi:hypothetical protein
MPPFELFRSLLQQATAEASRSTALKPLGWLVAMLLTSTLASFYYELPFGLGLTLLIISVVAILIYLGAYLYLLRFDRDALRSEKYSLQKIALEKGVFGDSITGSVDLTAVKDNDLLRRRNQTPKNNDHEALRGSHG